MLPLSSLTFQRFMPPKAAPFGGIRAVSRRAGPLAATRTFRPETA